MRYSKAALRERKWHKVVLHHNLADNHSSYKRIVANRFPDIDRFLRDYRDNDYMRLSGGHWTLLMLSEMKWLSAHLFLEDFNEDSYRGYGDWSKKKYSSAKTNRIT